MADRHWLEQISLYAEGQLPPDEVDALQTALRADAGLRRDFLEYLNLDAALEDLAADPGSGQRPREQSRPAAPRTLVRRIAWLAAAAAVLLAVTLAGWWLGRGDRGPDFVGERPTEKPQEPRPVRRVEILASGWQIEPIGDTEYRVLRDGRVRLERGDLVVESTARPAGGSPHPELTIETPAGTATSRGEWFCIGTHPPRPRENSKEPAMNPLSRVTRVLVLAGLVTLVNAQGSVSGGPDHLLAAEPGTAPMDKGLPQTAIKEIEPALAKALQEKAYPQAIRLIARKIALEGVIQGNKPEEKIIRLEAEIAKAPAEMRPMLEVIQADWYWQYFQHNRWRFMQRTATATGAPGTPGRGKDFTTWDLPRLFAEIDKHFQKALAAEEQLKKIPVQSFGELLDKGTMPDSYRPTLYDFVAHQALEFYNSGEQAAAKSEDAFELSADSPIFRPAKEFVAWTEYVRLSSLTNQAGQAGKPDVLTDSDSITLKAIRLYQQLLRFHQDDEDKSALLDADIERLSFGNNKAVGEEKTTLYKAALKRFVKQWGDHAISAIARYRWAEVLRQEGALVEAHDLAQQGDRAFPNTPGGDLCYNLMKQIEAKSANIMTERVWNEPSPSIRVSYRNLTKVYFRLVHEDWLTRLKTGKYRGEWIDDARRGEILAKKPDLAWSADLPATEDFQERAEDLPRRRT